MGNLKVVTWALPLLFTATKAMMDLMESMVRTGDTMEFDDRMIPFNEFTDFIGLPEIYAQEEKYGVRRG